jgi:flagellar hook protein FlgE
MIDFSIPLAGMNAAESNVNRTAAQVAQFGFSGGDTVDLSSEAVALIEARNSFAANASVVRTEDQMTGRLLNLTA